MQPRPPGSFRHPLLLTNRSVAVVHMFCQTEELSPISRGTEVHLRSICKRQQKTNVHILRPAYNVRGNDYEHVLDLGPSSDLSRLQKNGFDSATELRLSPREDEDLDSIPGDGHNSREPPRTPPSDDLSPGSPSDGYGPPPWSQTRFKLDCPFPIGVSPLPPFFPRSGGDNMRSALDLSPPPDSTLRDDNGRRRPNYNQRKSCEYCRFRKKKCSGDNTCVRCFRIGVDCVYMPDLIAKRMAEGLLGIRSPSPRPCFPCPTFSSPGDRSPTKSGASQLAHRDPAYPRVTPSSPDDETSTQLSRRGMKRRKGGANGNLRPTKRQKRPRAGSDPTRSVASCPDLPILRGNGPGSAGDLGAQSMEEFHSAGRVLGMVAGDMDFRNTELRCLSFGVLDRSLRVVSIPKRWDICKPREVLGDTIAAQPGYTTNNAHIPQPTSIATFGWFPHPEASPEMGLTRVETVPILSFNASPLLKTGPSLEPLTDVSVLSLLSPSSPPLSSAPVALPDIASDHDPTEPWTIDDWLAWYDYTFFSCDKHDTSAFLGRRRFYQQPNRTYPAIPTFLS